MEQLDMLMGGPDSYWGMVWPGLLRVLPELIAFTVCLVVCAVLWRRAPWAALWAIGAFALMLVIFLANTLLHPMITRMEWEGRMDYEAAHRVRFGLAIGSGVLHAITAGMLTIAVFTGRRGAQPPAAPVTAHRPAPPPPSRATPPPPPSGPGPA